MIIPDSDSRCSTRRALDEAIASEPKLPPPPLAQDIQPLPLESHLARIARRPQAHTGIVENGLVRLLDSGVRLPEHARVIVVAIE